MIIFPGSRELIFFNNANEKQAIFPYQYRKSWSRNPLVILDLSYDLSFKVICDFEGQIYRNHAISSLLLHVEVWVVMFAYRKSYIRNPMVVLDLSYDLSFKVIYDSEGQIYTNHAISSLLWPGYVQEDNTYFFTIFNCLAKMMIYIY